MCPEDGDNGDDHVDGANASAEVAPAPEWDDPAMVKHFMEYAGAAYGYTWFLMRDTTANLWRMYPHMRCFASCCCCCACCDPEEPGLIENDNCMRCNTAALKAMLPGLLHEDIVHISFKNRMMEVPYFVAIDHRYKKIVVSIRGTLSLEDTITDLCAQPESMASFDDSLKGHIVHCGMLKAAEYVLAQLQEKNTLNNAFSYHDTYQLVVTGHSLGAGTAVILSFMLRKKYPHVRCYAYSPPGGLLNTVAAEESKEFTVSAIVGKDPVPRLSLHSVERLKERMKRVLRECRLPKYQILASGLGSCCIKDWRRTIREEESVRRAGSLDSGDSTEPILDPASPSRVPSYESTTDNDNNKDRVELRKKVSAKNLEKLILPGKIFHLEQVNEDDDAKKSRRLREYRMTEKTAEDFADIKVSPNMLTDHFPHNVAEVLAAYNCPAVV